MLGTPAPHAVFGPMVAATEESISLGNPGVTDALEFTDGKIMVNKSHHFKVWLRSAAVILSCREACDTCVDGCACVHPRVCIGVCARAWVWVGVRVDVCGWVWVRARGGVGARVLHSTRGPRLQDLTQGLLPQDLTYQLLRDKVGLNALKEKLSQANAIAMVNWNSILGMTGIWEGLARDVLPGERLGRKIFVFVFDMVAHRVDLPPDTHSCGSAGLGGPRRLFFVDLCDPRKRTRQDLRQCLATLTKIQAHVDVLLSLNYSEAKQCLEVLGASYSGADENAEASRRAAVQLQQMMGIHMVSIHQLASCCAATATESAAVPG
jgi:hypothetical protein